MNNRPPPTECSSELAELLSALTPEQQERYLSQMEALARGFHGEGRPKRPREAMMVAMVTFTAEYDGDQVESVAGKTFVVPDHELVERFPQNFRLWEDPAPPDPEKLDQAFDEAVACELGAIETLRHALHAARQRPPAHLHRPPCSAVARAGRRGRTTVRSSAHSGDSGDSSDGEPDPPGLKTPPVGAGTAIAGRLCLCGCGESLTGRKADCEFVNDSHSKRFRRREREAKDARPTQSEPQRSLNQCGCRSAVASDPDGQPICLACGRAKGESPPVNGFDRRAAEMERDRGTFHLLDGQREAGHRSVAVYR